MYVKKSVLVATAIVLVIAVAVGTVMMVNPFGVFEFGDLIKFNMGVSSLKRYYYEEVEAEKIVDGALLGASLSVDDPYTVYIDKNSAQSFWDSVESDDYTGVGLYISEAEDGSSVEVISPLSGSPAEKAGIMTGDKIIEVDDETVKDHSLDEVATKMKGKEGTDVKLKIIKKSTGNTEEVTLTRAMIKRETVNFKMLKDRVGYIQITQFGVNTATEFIEAFNKLATDGMASLVVDLRNNPGGYMDVAVKIADCFLDEGEIVYTLNKYGQKRDYMATKGSSKAPMMILTNGGSASASEVFVGAMKDYGLAKIVGERTFGKGVTQITRELPDGSIMKITESKYYTPNGVCIHDQGIEPDIEVEMSDEKYSRLSELSFDEDIQLKRAVYELKK